MSGLDVVFALDHPFVDETAALTVFYRAGIRTQSAGFCVLVLLAYWLLCVVGVLVVFAIRFHRSILKQVCSCVWECRCG